MCAKIKHLLEGIDSNVSDEILTNEVEYLLNSQLDKVEKCKDFVSSILKEKDSTKKLQEVYNSRSDQIIGWNYNAYKKIIYKDYRFINYDTYNFNLNYIRTHKDCNIKKTVRNLVSLIERENIIELLNEINYVNYLENLIQNDRRKFHIDFKDNIKKLYNSIFYKISNFEFFLVVFCLLYQLQYLTIKF